MRVAVVGFGGAGTSIIGKTVEILEKISYYDGSIALYIVNDTVKLEIDVIFRILRTERTRKGTIRLRLGDNDFRIGWERWKFVSLRQ